MIALAKSDNLIAFPQPQSKSNEWYTPARYVNAAREVMGDIDLDPASCKEANLIVRAKRYYTEKEDGLAQEWKAETAWLNPPYGSTLGVMGRTGNQQGLTKPFVFKLIEEYERGNIKQAILCLTTDTDARWFIPLWNYVICFATHKVMFHRPGQSNSGQFYGTCFVYLGSNFEKFTEVFSKFGRIAKAIDTPKVQPINLSLWEIQA